MTGVSSRRIAWIILAALLLPSVSSCKKKRSDPPPPPPYIVTFFYTPPAGTLVKTPFDVEIEITERATGLPAAFSPPVQFNLEKAAGGGNLIGQVVVQASGSPTTFPAVTYDALDSLTLRVTSVKSAPVLSGAISFDVEIQPSTSDLGFLAPGDPIPSVDFTLLDGLGALYPVAGSDLYWDLTDTGSTLVVQSGSEPFGGTAVATVSLAPISVESSYLLRANLQGSSNEATVNLGISSLVLENLPGPFVALKSARVGHTYLDDVSFAVPGAVEWQLLSGSIPGGITLDTTTGVLSGTANTATNGEFTIYARTVGVLATPIRCALAVFSPGETEWVAGQDFTGPGPFAPATTTSDSTIFTSSFDGGSFTTNLIIYHPDLATISSPLPLYVHHRGRGFNYNHYSNVLRRIAEHGFICVTVQDFQSFRNASGSPPPLSSYDGPRADAGMESASAFQEAALNRMLARSSTPGDPFEGKIDETKVFVGGHSRGGGATHGSHVRGLEMKINGVIYFMPFDLRFFSSTRPPPFGPVFPAYSIPDIQPRLPSLMIMAERDNDLFYPFADQLIERVSGQAHSVTVYGGIHAYLGDSNFPEPGASAYISRAEQQDIIVNQVLAFLKRWGEMDLSLEGFLYGNEHKGSSQLGAASLRNMVDAILVDDFQDFSVATNSLGEANSYTGGTRAEVSMYPTIPGSWFSTLGIRNNQLTFSGLTAVYGTALPLNTDLTGRERLVFRCAQTSLQGYDWVTFEVRLTDRAAEEATITLFDRNAPSTTYLPDYQGGNPRIYARFLDVQVALPDFAQVNPALDLNDLSTLEFLFDFGAPPGAGEQIFLDDIRFE